ncbi:cytochrome b [Microvirga antarctica]|uniref:cytochrome b n=1 Tax=Microvirga antarctica TaxID=2819233 RepID=UPI001FECE07D|nr:cytochrome b/b6 domain-containing protein [Microvirga antarctica]
MSAEMNSKLSYDRVTIGLHWATAALVALLWVMGQTADFFPRGPLRDTDWSLHFVFGFGLALILIARLLWRLGPGGRLPPAETGFLGLLASITHFALYGLLIAVVALGIANAFVRGVSFFGLWSLPRIGDPTLRRSLTEWHELAANLIMVIALVHAGAALAHHYLWHDGILQRMLPSKGRPIS